jgi:ribosomal protein S8
MSINDPLSDMIARIKNAAERKRAKVSTPASKLRGRVLDVLQDEGYIRGYALIEQEGKHPEFEVAASTRRSKISSPSRMVLASPSCPRRRAS